MEGHDRTRERRYSIQKTLYEISFFLEFVLAIIVISLVVMEIISTIGEMSHFFSLPDPDTGYTILLKRALDIVIGVEFIKMLCRHNMDSVIEVLMFTMTRHLIVEDTSMMDGLICIIAVSILFVVRKYLFVDKIDRMPTFHSPKQVPSSADAPAPEDTKATQTKAPQ